MPWRVVPVVKLRGDRFRGERDAIRPHRDQNVPVSTRRASLDVHLHTEVAPQPPSATRNSSDREALAAADVAVGETVLTGAGAIRTITVVRARQGVPCAAFTEALAGIVEDGRAWVGSRTVNGALSFAVRTARAGADIVVAVSGVQVVAGGDYGGLDAAVVGGPVG